MSDPVKITLELPPKVAAHILDVLATAFPSDEPQTPSELVKLAVKIFTMQKWLDARQADGENERLIILTCAGELLLDAQVDDVRDAVGPFHLNQIAARLDAAQRGELLHDVVKAAGGIWDKLVLGEEWERQQ